MRVITSTLSITFAPHPGVGSSITARCHHESSWTVPSRLLVHPFMLFSPEIRAGEYVNPSLGHERRAKWFYFLMPGEICTHGGAGSICPQ